MQNIYSMNKHDKEIRYNMFLYTKIILAIVILYEIQSFTDKLEYWTGFQMPVDIASGT